jgi:excinuclease ABC subunit B
MSGEQRFVLRTEFHPSGDQPAAIEGLVQGLTDGLQDQVLLGATGTGKTFTVACVVERCQRPALVLAPNKSLAAQIYGELAELFPDNAVEYFVSYYDYYQPEAYIPQSDTYIEKDSSINERIDRMRHSATRSVLERRDVIVVASVSCIYGIGSRAAYEERSIALEVGHMVDRDEVLEELIDMQYERGDIDFHRGSFRVRGDLLEIYPAHEEESALRISLWGDEVESIQEIDPLRGEARHSLNRVRIYPSSHYVTQRGMMEGAIAAIEAELEERLRDLRNSQRLLEAQRLEQRTRYDLDALRNFGHTKGIENYSRHLTGRQPGDHPDTLLHFLADDALVIIDESHVTVPQIGAMLRGDQSRKTNLVEHGFRLPSALDNRPLSFEEFRASTGQTIHMSATPGDWELEQTAGVTVEQVIRPTGLVDPPVEVRGATHQVDDLVEQLRSTIQAGYRALVTTLTKRMAEDLTDYLGELGLAARYLHSDIDAIARMEVLRDLRRGAFDVLVGINLLREGLDLPEVALVAVLDADKEGFLRSTRSLIQTIGRAARNVDGRVILYADRVTDSMRDAIDETDRRRAKQLAYNVEHGITPASVQKAIPEILDSIFEADYVTVSTELRDLEEFGDLSVAELDAEIEQARRAMKQAAAKLQFERAAELRDRVRRLEGLRLAWP